MAAASPVRSQYAQKRAHYSAVSRRASVAGAPSSLAGCSLISCHLSCLFSFIFVYDILCRVMSCYVMLCFVLSIGSPFSSCHVMSGQVTLYPVMWRPFWRTAWWKDVNLFERCNVVDFFRGLAGEAVWIASVCVRVPKQSYRPKS